MRRAVGIGCEIAPVLVYPFCGGINRMQPTVSQVSVLEGPGREGPVSGRSQGRRTHLHSRVSGFRSVALSGSMRNPGDRRTIAAPLLTALTLLMGIGCAPMGDDDDSQPSANPTFTWYRDLQPVIHRECSSCHFEGGIGPFPLETYEQAKSFAVSMAESVADRSMPPWLPALESSCIPLKDARVLTTEEIAMFRTWADEGAPLGNPAMEQDYPSNHPQLETVSFEKGPDVDYVPDASVLDDYRCFVIEPDQTQDQYIVGYDIKPGIPWLVHHVNVVIAEGQDARKQDAADSGPGWNCVDGFGLKKLALVGAWAPGTLPILFPPDTGIMLAKDQVLVTQVHYNTLNGDVAPDNSVVLFQFAESPVKERAYIAPLPNSSFEIPPNSTNYSSSFELELPFTAKVWGVGAHMHEKGSWFTSSVTRAGEETCMLYIDRWRYAWQQGYFFDTDFPVPVEIGDIAKVTCAWNNPTDRTITWAEGVDDEMCMGYFYVIGLDENTPGFKTFMDTGLQTAYGATSVYWDSSTESIDP